jgi:hypothetical protein
MSYDPFNSKLLTISEDFVDKLNILMIIIAFLINSGIYYFYFLDSYMEYMVSSGNEKI